MWIMYQVLYQPLYSFGNKFRPRRGPTKVPTSYNAPLIHILVLGVAALNRLWLLIDFCLKNLVG